jgi:hypothetical protein
MRCAYGKISLFLFIFPFLQSQQILQVVFFLQELMRIQSARMDRQCWIPGLKGHCSSGHDANLFPSGLGGLLLQSTTRFFTLLSQACEFLFSLLFADLKSNHYPWSINFTPNPRPSKRYAPEECMEIGL